LDLTKGYIMKQLAVGAALAVIAATPVLADHNNPWATPEDTLLAQNHDDNQEQSVGTPGEDEMRGVMVQDARRGSDDRGGRSDAAHGGGRGR
jgi:hypothetical protein